MAEPQKQNIKMVCSGMAFSVVQDLPVPNKFNFLQNIRILTEGIIEARPTLVPFVKFNRADTQEVPHSIKSAVNKANAGANTIIGVGSKIFSTFVGIAITIIEGVPYSIITLGETDSGYSGKPLSLFDFRPEASIQPYIYIGDVNKFRKVGVDNTISDVGIIPPHKAAIWSIAKPERKIIDSIETGSEASWNNLTGSAGAPTLNDRINTTVTAFLADGALPNFASIIPAAAIPDLAIGAIVKLNGADELIVDDVLPATLLAGVATISKIVYDVGTTGLATIVLSVPNSSIKRDTVLKLVNATPTTEYVRVQDVTLDDKGIPSIRISTVATFAATNTVTGVDSFRVYTANAYVSPNTIIGKYIKSAIGATGISSITRIFNSDLTNTGTKALTDEDIFHMSMMISDTSKITEIQIQLAIDGFTENYYYYSISPNFFTGSVAQTTPTISVIQQAAQRRELLARNRFGGLARSNTRLVGLDDTFEEPDSFSTNSNSINTTEAILGQNQWTEFDIPLGLFTKVGADNSKTKKDITAIRISVNAIAAVDISIDSLWVGGSDGLNSIGEGFLPYIYIWRARNPDTKEPSNWSPPIRSGIKLTRGRVQLTFPNATVDYPATYKIDIARFGGSINDFRIIGSIKNDGSTYVDNSSDRLVADNDLAGRLEGNIDAVFDFFKPFAVLDLPKKGTCDVTGNLWTWKTGDKLNISYPRGTLIVIDGKVNKFYTNPTSTGATDAATSLELEFDMGVKTDVVFEIQDPLLTGQPLPIVFGPFGEGNLGLFFFGLGYKKAAGNLYWLDGNSPGTMSDLNFLEITSPAEPLMNGGIYDGLPYVWTNEKSFQILPTYSGEQFSFIARENANSRGLFATYAICFGRNYIYHLTENADGIVRVAGNGNPQYITEGISSLFYNNGKIPSKTVLVDGTKIFPPDYTFLDDLRFFTVKDYVFFRFKDTEGKDICLVFDEKRNDWISYDVYINNKINGIYFQEVDNFSTILAGIPDGVAKFSMGGTYEKLQLTKVIPFAFDAGNSRILKYFYEETLSIDPGTGGFTIKNFYDNGDFFDAAINFVGEVAHKRKEYIVEIADKEGQSAQNISTVFEWHVTDGVKLFEEILHYELYADKIIDRSGSIEDAGNLGEKLWQGVIIQTDTFGEDKILKYYDDLQINVVAEITINHDGYQTIAYSFPQPFISHTILRFSEDEVKWMEPTEVYIFDIEPESAKVWEGEFNISDLTGLVLIKRIAIAYRSTENSTIKLFFDDGIVQEYDLPNSNEDWHKEFFYIAAKKWKACKYRVESEGEIRIYKKHCEFWMRSVNSNQPFIPMQVMGGDSNISDIKI